MLWILSIIISVVFGYEIVTFFVKNELDCLTRICFGMPLGVIYQSFFAMFVQLYVKFGLLNYICVTFPQILIVLLFKKINTKCLTRIDLLFIDKCILYTSWIFILYRQYLIYFEDGIYTRGAPFSDFYFHFQYISSFAFGCNRDRKSFFDIKTLIFNGARLAYPTFPNFHASFLIASCDCSLQNSVRWTAFLMGFSFVFLLHKFSLIFTNNHFSAMLAIPLWIFSGGLGFTTFFEIKESNNYIHNLGGHLRAFWFQSMSHIFQPQRSATFSLPLCLVSLITLVEGSVNLKPSFFILAAITVGILPQVQVHAYVSLAIFCIPFATINFLTTPRKVDSLKCWIIFALLSNVIAFPLLTPYLDRTASNDGFLQYRPVWNISNYRGNHLVFFSLWYRALGCFGLISILFGFVFINSFQMKIYGSSLLGFLIFSSIMFQPWELDNTKFFHSCWFLIACPLVAQYFSNLLISKSLLISHISFILYISCLISGFLCFMRTEKHRVAFYDKNIQQFGEWGSENLPLYSLNQMSRHVINPLSSFSGRSTFLGYIGWVHSHGLFDEGRVKEVTKIEKGEGGKYQLDKNVTYVIKFLYNSTELAKFNNISFWELIYEDEKFLLYKFFESNFYSMNKSDPNRTKRKRKFNHKRNSSVNISH